MRQQTYQWARILLVLDDCRSNPVGCAVQVEVGEAFPLDHECWMRREAVDGFAKSANQAVEFRISRHETPWVPTVRKRGLRPHILLLTGSLEDDIDMP